MMLHRNINGAHLFAYQQPVLKSARVKDLRELYWLNAHFLTPSNINTLTANYEYSRSNGENLRLPIQLQLSKKPKKFCCNFIEILFLH